MPRSMNLLTARLALVFTLLGSSLFGNEDWKELIAGKSLDNWVQRGGKATYELIDGVIVGTTVANTPNSFLCTEENYGDFILEFEVWLDPRLNSGVQVRSLSSMESS